MKTNVIEWIGNVEYNPVSHRFELDYKYVRPRNGGLKRQRFWQSLSYHDFSQVKTLYPDFNMKWWYWSQLVTNLFFKALHPKCTAKYRQTSDATLYLKQFKRVVEFTTKGVFKVNLRPEIFPQDNLHKQVFDRFLILLQAQFCLKDRYEIDAKLSEKYIEINMLQTKDTEPS